MSPAVSGMGRSSTLRASRSMRASRSDSSRAVFYNRVAVRVDGTASGAVRERQGREGATSDVIERARRGDPEAFELLVAEHERRVWGLALQICGHAEDAREIAQETFLKVHRHLASYDATRPFPSWLYRITVNCAYDFIRRRPGHLPLEAAPGEEAPPIPDDRERPDRRVEQREIRSAVHIALALLTPQERTVFVLRDVEGRDTADIAWILGCSSITVRRHSSNARLKLRRALGDQFGGGEA